MPDLDFQIEGVAPARFSVTPQLLFRLTVRNSNREEAVQTVALRCQVQIDVTKRRYSPQEQERLRDLFDAPERWSQTLRTLLWTHVSHNVSAFSGELQTDLPVPCTFDFNVASTKYFYGLSEGEIPLCFLFSGTVFYQTLDGGHLLTGPISWEKEARFRLPVNVWREMMDVYYPNSAWLNLRRDVFERLYEYKVQRGIPTWEQALESMMQEAEVSHS